MAETTRPVAMITGASSGIGAEFARQLCARGFDLILVARREEKLRGLAGSLSTHVEILMADLTRDDGLSAAEGAIRACDRLEMLVNNAGFGTLGRFWETDRGGQLRMHELHVIATMRLTGAALSGMVPRRRGAIVNVSSVAAFGQSPGNVSYCATKAWMNSFTEGIDMELRSIASPVKVQSLCPGFTRTEFHQTLGVDARTIPRMLWLEPADVVRASLAHLTGRKAIVISTLRYKLAAGFLKHLPAGVVNAFRPGGSRV